MPNLKEINRRLIEDESPMRNHSMNQANSHRERDGISRMHRRDKATKAMERRARRRELDNFYNQVFPTMEYQLQRSLNRLLAGNGSSSPVDMAYTHEYIDLIETPVERVGEIEITVVDLIWETR